jgi:hypothetical protein
MHWPLKAEIVLGTRVAETILASGHVRPHTQAGHMIASDPIKSLLNDLARRRPFSNRVCLVKWILTASLPYRGHGSLRGRKVPPQYLVRSTGTAMSTTGSPIFCAAQGLPSQLTAPSPRWATIKSEATSGSISMEVSLGSGGHLGPAERLSRAPDAMQDHRELSGKGDARFAWA